MLRTIKSNRCEMCVSHLIFLNMVNIVYKYSHH
nr:MAG TPA: hypothetical protein [Caudoviricetes sp.]